MARIHIVRHGNTFDPGEVVTRVGARTDLALSQSGLRQAEALADHFKDTDFIAAFCSPLKRTRQTARAILKARRIHPPLLIAPFLTEIDYGKDENRPEAEIIARIGQDAIDAWDNDARPPPGWQVDPPALIAAWAGLFSRAARLDENDDVLVVTSNGVARFALDAAIVSPHGMARKLKTGAWGEVEVMDNGEAIITRWNERP